MAQRMRKGIDKKNKDSLERDLLFPCVTRIEFVTAAEKVVNSMPYFTQSVHSHSYTLRQPPAAYT